MDGREGSFFRRIAVYLPVRESRSFQPKNGKVPKHEMYWRFKYEKKQLPQETSQEFKNQLFSMSF